MQIAPRNPLDNFLSFFLKAREAGLIIAENRLQLAKVHSALGDAGLLLANSWRGTLRQLAMDSPVAALLSAPMPKEFFDVIQQYQRRAGMIQIMDRQSLDLTTVHCDPAFARLLLVVANEDLVAIEKEYPLKNNVGLIEII